MTSKVKASEVDASHEIISAEKIGDIMEAVVARGDISKLSADERGKYYVSLCRSLGLNPATQPFEYVTLQGKMQLYATKRATDQLRAMHGVSIKIISQQTEDGTFRVHVQATDRHGREDEDIGALSIQGLKGQPLLDAMMKCVTKAKRRVTLSICGLGFLSDVEAEDSMASERPRRQAARVARVVSVEGQAIEEFAGKTPFEAIDEAKTPADMARIATWLASYTFADESIKREVEKAFAERQEALRAEGAP